MYKHKTRTKEIPTLSTIERDIKASLENCAGLGRDAYGDYIDRCINGLMKKIETFHQALK